MAVSTIKKQTYTKTRISVDNENVQGWCTYFVIGDRVFVNIGDLLVKQQITNDFVIFSGLPTGNWTAFLVNRLHGDSYRLQLTNAGTIAVYYDTIPADTSHAIHGIMSA